LKIAEEEFTPNYIKIKITDASRDDLANANIWCLKAQCGKQVNFKSFAFKTEAEYMMFKLKWL
jgi:hypothetical protein